MLDVLIMIPEITKGMKSIGSKALLDIKKQIKVIDNQIQTVKTIDQSAQITVATGFENDKIEHALKKFSNIQVIYNPLYKETNQAEALRLYLSNYYPTKLFIINNGILLKPKAVAKTSLSGESKIFILDKPKENFNLGCATNQQTEYIFYDLPEPWSECIYLNSGAITSMRDALADYNTKQMYLFEIVNTIISKHIPITKHYVSKTNIMKITGIKDLGKAKTFI